MRLLETETLQLHEFHGDDIPPYIILSHTWGAQEVSYQDLVSGRGPTREGWNKVLGCCGMARAHGYDYAWIDTCCIDKSSSAELSEAINSMYRWYSNADLCYVYLPDVTSIFTTAESTRDKEPSYERQPSTKWSEFRESRWFTRGWTLQELIAPPMVHLFDRSWRFIGTRTGLKRVISQVTGIDAAVFEDGDLSRYSIAQKMSWASERRTTRIEDEAYCLLGLFGINMPLLYGEGHSAFRRLQEEIIRRTKDYSILAHCSYDNKILARSPSDFKNCGGVGMLDVARGDGVTISSVGIHMTLPTLSGGRRENTWALVGRVWSNRQMEVSPAPQAEVILVELVKEDGSGFYVQGSRTSTPRSHVMSERETIVDTPCILKHDSLDQVPGADGDASRGLDLTFKVLGEVAGAGDPRVPNCLELKYLDSSYYHVQRDADSSFHLTAPRSWSTQSSPLAFLVGFAPPAPEHAVLIALTPTVRSVNLVAFDVVRLISQSKIPMESERGMVYTESKNRLQVVLRSPPAFVEDPTAYQAPTMGRQIPTIGRARQVWWGHRMFRFEVGHPHRGISNNRLTGLVGEEVTVTREAPDDGGKMIVSVSARRRQGRWDVLVFGHLRAKEDSQWSMNTAGGK